MSDLYDPSKNAYENIETLKATMKTPTFNGIYDAKEKKEYYATIFALRMTVDSTRKKGKTLKKPVNAEKMKQNYDALMASPAFDSFIQETGYEELTRLMTAGHGGEAEDKYKEFILRQPALPENLPPRYTPTSRQRIDDLKKQIEKTPENMVALGAEIFRTRRAAYAVRKKRRTLDGSINMENYSKSTDLSKEPVFQNFAKNNAGFRSAITRGHGGEAELLFKDHVTKDLDHIPATIPDYYMPTALERTEALQEKIKAPNFSLAENKETVLTEMFATRMSVEAIRGEKNSLDKKVNAQKLNESVEFWSKNETFKNYIKNDPSAIAGASAGHGGQMEDNFRKFIAKQDKLPEDVPDRFMPTALDRIDALKEKIEDRGAFANRGDDEKLDLYVQLMATRTAVGAVRKKSSSLEVPITQENYKKALEEWKKDEAFAQFVQENPELARSQALEGHSGALEDSYKEYLKTMPRIPDNVQTKYLPNMEERIEGLQSKIKSKEFNGLSEDEKTAVYAELLATREAGGAKRKDSDSLKASFDPKKKNEIYEKLINNQSFKDFCKNREAIAKDGATSGHGGALEDQFKNYVKYLDHIPDDIPERFMPTASERIDILKAKIKATTNPERKQQLMTELMASRMAVDSVRKDGDSLKQTIKPENWKKAYNALNENNETYKNFLKNSNQQALTDAATSGHGGGLDDMYKQHVIDTAVKEGVMPTGVPERYRPLPKEIADGLKKDLTACSKRGSEWINEHKDEIMKKTAALMYVTKKDMRNSSTKGKLASVAHDKMEEGVRTLMESEKFKNMFNTLGPRKAAMKAGSSVTALFNDFVKAPGAEPVEPQPQVQPQIQQNVLQNQQQVNNAQMNQPNANIPLNQQNPVNNNQVQPVQIPNPQIQPPQNVNRQFNNLQPQPQQIHL